MADIADKLLKLMYEWIEEAQDCSSNLRALADELVKLRNNCNTAETVGSTVAVVGSVLSIGAAFFTAGASLALLGVVGGVGAGVSIVTKITEALMSSSKLKRITEIDKKCTEITDEIKRLYDQLREKCPSSSDDQKDHYVTKEILKAISRRNCLEIDTDIFDDAIRHLLRTGTVQAVTTGLVVSLVGEVLFMFSLLPSLALKGGAEAGKAWVSF
ncbi:uncharacterized protein [Eucyclogobius newberryi]|uniref:uncharacterized protein n=1 Tax=Eucyclogobius newberryi TaxID=166745 RepID=UPI003B5B9C9F